MFTRTYTLVAIAVLGLTMLGGRPVAAAEAAPRVLTLKDCLELAAQGNPELLSAQSEVAAATAAHRGSLGAFGPKIKVEATYLRWDKAMDLNLAESMSSGSNQQQSQTPIDLPGFDATQDESLQNYVGQSLGAAFASFNTPMRVRNQTTSSASVTISQALTPLWTIREAETLRSLGVDIAEVQAERARHDMVFQVTQAFYRALQAQGMAEIAEKSVAQINAQVTRAHAFFDQGMVGQNDVLRAELGLAAAKQRQIQTRGMVEMAKASLVSLLGLPASLPVELAGVITQAPSAPTPEGDTIEQLALKNRPELREIERRNAQARAAVRLAWSQMLPTIAAVGNYSINKGSAFQQEKAWYVGGVLQWDVWEWGSSYFKIDEAEAHSQQAKEMVNKIENLVRLDARNTTVTLSSSKEALLVASQAVRQAEENFRIENKRYEASQSTTFDVLDAETLLTTARTQEQQALYDYMIALASLTRVTGGADSGAQP